MTPEEKRAEAIDSVLDAFDFESVHKAMVALKWTWADAETEDGIPSIADLRKAARRLLRDVTGVHSMGSEILCGGFRAKIGAGWLSLSFEIDSEYADLS